MMDSLEIIASRYLVNLIIECTPSNRTRLAQLWRLATVLDESKYNVSIDMI